MFPWGFYTPRTLQSASTWVCLCVYVHAGGEEKVMWSGHWAKDVISSLLLEMFVSAHPHIIHRNDPAEDHRWDESLFLEAAHTKWFTLEFQQGLLQSETSCPGPGHI